jgi:[ribosomal protein S5]-alanine N-acetyltransferase
MPSESRSAPRTASPQSRPRTARDTAAPKPRLLTPRLRLLAPTLVQAEAVRAFLLRNRDHLAPWSPPAAPGWQRLEAQQRALDRSRTHWEAGVELRWWLAARGGDNGDELVGCAALTQIARGPFQNAMLGYQIDAAQEGQGLMFEALQAVLKEAFSSRVALHRIQANVRPENERSLKLLQRLGFAIEGFAPKYLYIDGAWRDHVLTAIRHPRPGSVRLGG